MQPSCCAPSAAPDPYGKQIDGIGGGTSSTSKIVIVGKSQREDADVDYLFGHVAIGEALIDYSGNCGNLTAAVAPFAIEEKLVPATEGITTVRIWQANIDKHIVAHVPVRNGQPVGKTNSSSTASPSPAPKSGWNSSIRPAAAAASCFRPATRPTPSTSPNSAS